MSYGDGFREVTVEELMTEPEWHDLYAITYADGDGWRHVIHVGGDYVRGRKISWIKLFRRLTGAGLLVSKLTFDLLDARGEDLDEVQSVIDASAMHFILWYSFLGMGGGPEENYVFLLRRAIELAQLGASEAELVADMLAMELDGLYDEVVSAIGEVLE